MIAAGLYRLLTPWQALRRMGGAASPVRVILAILVLASSGQAFADERESITYAVYPYPPIATKMGEHRGGYATEIMTEALRRANLQVNVIDLPGNRALSYVGEETGIFIAGTKTPEAFDKHPITWPFCFETVTHALIVQAKKGYTSFIDLPLTARIGAFLSYTLRDYLVEKGYTDLHLVKSNDQLADLLMMDRIDAWASFDSAARFILEEKGMDLGAVRSLPIKKFSFCAVTSNKTDPALLDRVRAAYQSMVADGSRAAIRARYERYLGPDTPPDPSTWPQRPHF
ncbi:hypothetical protein A6A04_18460 [Paramagnetospirillum marisnigri]|uniref:Uncharacterized protein n=1 Tax=Paramagnetospirillum marisnigri TaxID=1285242 RepID=A0A178MMF5_9PROT|nr:transporter substrate-binding domain-containing protein [Paramagnetospirillum marisnigri]OAN49932.1 hypothetical protein A6A04_18460 [Paramagnetospirillum marisnigri]